jgi:hypothetical protein
MGRGSVRILRQTKRPSQVIKNAGSTSRKKIHREGPETKKSRHQEHRFAASANARHSISPTRDLTRRGSTLRPGSILWATVCFVDMLEDLKKRGAFHLHGVLLSSPRDGSGIRSLRYSRKKTKAGLDVRIIYDDVGQHETSCRRSFEKAAAGKTASRSWPSTP